MSVSSSPTTSAPSTFEVSRSRSTDPDEQAQNLGLLEQRYDQLSAGAFSGSLVVANFGDLTLFEERLSQSVYQSGCAPQGQLTVAAGCELSSEGYWNGRYVSTDAVIAFPSGREFELRSPRLAFCVGLSFSGNTLHAITAESQIGDVDPLFLSRDTWRDPRSAAQRLSYRVSGILDIVRTMPEIFREPAARRQMISDLTEDLCFLFALSSSAGRALRPGSYPRIARRAREFISCRVVEPPNIEEICNAIGCSRRALQYAFQHIYGISPLTYLRTIRLNAVRRALTRPQLNTRVRDVASRNAFWHLPRFARQYADMFGELPSETLASHRAQQRCVEEEWIRSAALSGI